MTEKTRPATKDEAQAIWLYALISYDFFDFLDALREKETTDDAVQTLHQMFLFPKEKHGEVNQSLNNEGALWTERELERRGLVATKPAG